MIKKYNRRDFTKFIGASVSLTGVGALTLGHANASPLIVKATNISAKIDIDRLTSSIGPFSTQVSQIVNATTDSVMPVHMGVVTNGGYRRSQTDPTTRTLELAMADLENGEDAIVTSSGMSSITQTLITLLSSGDTILYHQYLYSSVIDFIEDDLARYGVKAVKVDMQDTDLVGKLIAEHRPNVVFFESNTNPRLEVIDVDAMVKLSRDVGSLVIVDNTFTTPMLMKPLDLGADIVINSMTKYICGHGDALGGVTVSSKAIIERLNNTQIKLGANLTPEKAYLMLRGLRSLALRMPVHCKNAVKLAEWLESLPNVKRVNYPGLKSNVGYEIATRQASGYGGLLSFVIEGGTEAGQSMQDNVKMCKARVSFGEPNTLVTGGQGEEEFFNTEPGFVRVALGLEGIDDIINDFKQAMNIV